MLEAKIALTVITDLRGDERFLDVALKKLPGRVEQIARDYGLKMDGLDHLLALMGNTPGLLLQPKDLARFRPALRYLSDEFKRGKKFFDAQDIKDVAELAHYFSQKGRRTADHEAAEEFHRFVGVKDWQAHAWEGKLGTAARFYHRLLGSGQRAREKGWDVRVMGADIIGEALLPEEYDLHWNSFRQGNLRFKGLGSAEIEDQAFLHDLGIGPKRRGAIYALEDFKPLETDVLFAYRWPDALDPLLSTLNEKIIILSRDPKEPAEHRKAREARFPGNLFFEEEQGIVSVYLLSGTSGFRIRYSWDSNERAILNLDAPEIKPIDLAKMSAERSTIKRIKTEEEATYDLLSEHQLVRMAIDAAVAHKPALQETFKNVTTAERLGILLAEFSDQNITLTQHTATFTGEYEAFERDLAKLLNLAAEQEQLAGRNIPIEERVKTLGLKIKDCLSAIKKELDDEKLARKTLRETAAKRLLGMLKPVHACYHAIANKEIAHVIDERLVSIIGKDLTETIATLPPQSEFAVDDAVVGKLLDREPELYSFTRAAIAQIQEWVGASIGKHQQLTERMTELGTQLATAREEAVTAAARHENSVKELAGRLTGIYKGRIPDTTIDPGKIIASALELAAADFKELNEIKEHVEDEVIPLVKKQIGRLFDLDMIAGELKKKNPAITATKAEGIIRAYCSLLDADKAALDQQLRELTDKAEQEKQGYERSLQSLTSVFLRWTRIEAIADRLKAGYGDRIAGIEPEEVILAAAELVAEDLRQAQGAATINTDLAKRVEELTRQNADLAGQLQTRNKVVTEQAELYEQRIKELQDGIIQLKDVSAGQGTEPHETLRSLEEELRKAQASIGVLAQRDEEIRQLKEQLAAAGKPTSDAAKLAEKDAELTRLTTELAEKRAAYDKEVSALNQIHQDALTGLGQRHENALADLRREYDVKLAQDTRKKDEELKKHYDNRLAEEQRKFTEQRGSLETEYKRNLEENERTIAALEQRLQSKPADKARAEKTRGIERDERIRALKEELRLLKANYSNAIALRMQTEALFEGNSKKAEKLYLRAHDLAPFDETKKVIAANIGGLYYHRGEYVQALEWFSKAPDTAEIRKYTATCKNKLATTPAKS